MDLSDKYDLDKLYESEDDDWADSLQGKFSSNHSRYENLELIAKGGMKEIYKAYDANNCRHIALAKLRPDVPEEQCEDFLKEAYLTASLEHPNIISLYDIDYDDQRNPIFTMELKVGDSLEQIIRKRSEGDPLYLKNFHLRKRMEIFISICNAISYAHSVKILHLDIKPGNIQVGKHGEVQVCDWGLGTKIDEANRPKSVKLVKGTPGFMAPEQIDHSLGIDTKTDIYSLGALLYMLLSDKAPIAGGVNTIIEKTVSGEILSQKLEIEISQSLNAVVKKAMAKDKSERYESVEELKKEVESYLSGRSTSAENASFVKELKLFFGRNKSICLIIIIASVILILSTSIFISKLNLTNADLESSNKRVVEVNKHLLKSNEETKSALEQSRQNYELYKEKAEKERELMYKRQVAEYVGKKFYFHKAKSLSNSIDNIYNFYQSGMNDKLIGLEIYNLLFVTQKFDKILEIKSNRIPEIGVLAKEFSKCEKDRNALLKEEDFLRLLKKLGTMKSHIKTYAEPLVYFHWLNSKQRKISLEVLKELLKNHNATWDSSGFKFDQNNYSVTLEGINLSRLYGGSRMGSGESFLRFLKVNSLILSNTSLDSFDNFLGLEMKTLDISGSKIETAGGINKLKSLGKLIISKDQLKDQNKVPSWIEIIIR